MKNIFINLVNKINGISLGRMMEKLHGATMKNFADWCVGAAYDEEDLDRVRKLAEQAWYDWHKAS